MLGDKNFPYTIYDFSETEHSKYPEAILMNHTGILLSDGTNKFNGIVRAGATAAACWAHVHCAFEDAWKDNPPPKTKLADAISYTLNRWDALCVFTDNEYVDISNNACERSIKPIVIGRNNWLFAGSVEGGHASATLMTLVQTCERLNIDPFEYFKDVLTRFPNANMRDVADFLPDRWLALKQIQTDSI